VEIIHGELREKCDDRVLQGTSNEAIYAIENIEGEYPR